MRGLIISINNALSIFNHVKTLSAKLVSFKSLTNKILNSKLFPLLIKSIKNIVEITSSNNNIKDYSNNAANNNTDNDLITDTFDFCLGMKRLLSYRNNNKLFKSVISEINFYVREQDCLNESDLSIIQSLITQTFFYPKIKAEIINFNNEIIEILNKITNRGFRDLFAKEILNYQIEFDKFIHDIEMIVELRQIILDYFGYNRKDCISKYDKLYGNTNNNNDDIVVEENDFDNDNSDTSFILYKENEGFAEYCWIYYRQILETIGNMWHEANSCIKFELLNNNINDETNNYEYFDYSEYLIDILRNNKKKFVNRPINHTNLDINKNDRITSSNAPLNQSSKENREAISQPMIKIDTINQGDIKESNVCKKLTTDASNTSLNKYKISEDSTVIKHSNTNNNEKEKEDTTNNRNSIYITINNNKFISTKDILDLESSTSSIVSLETRKKDYYTQLMKIKSKYKEIKCNGEIKQCDCILHKNLQSLNTIGEMRSKSKNKIPLEKESQLKALFNSSNKKYSHLSNLNNLNQSSNKKKSDIKRFSYLNTNSNMKNKETLSNENFNNTNIKSNYNNNNIKVRLFDSGNKDSFNKINKIPSCGNSGKCSGGLFDNSKISSFSYGNISAKNNAKTNSNTNDHTNMLSISSSNTSIYEKLTKLKENSKGKCRIVNKYE